MANGNYGRIMNNFMGELPSPLGNMVSMTDLALAVLRHICLIACVWLTHSLWHIWMFHSVNYIELVRGENRFVQGFVWAVHCVYIQYVCLLQNMLSGRWPIPVLQYVHLSITCTCTLCVQFSVSSQCRYACVGVLHNGNLNVGTWGRLLCFCY